MKMKILTGICVIAMAAQAEASLVNIRIMPAVQVVPLGSPVNVTIVADIEAPVVGWGLDVSASTPGIISQSSPPVIGASWLSTFAPDGDGLAGIASPFAPTNGSVSGNGVLLATMSFTADAVGNTSLVPGVTAGDLNEGFALDPTGFADLVFHSASITVVPEPASLSLVLVGATGTIRRRRR